MVPFASLRVTMRRLFVQHGPEGVHGFEGRYREVTPPARLAQTFEWDGMPGYVSRKPAHFIPSAARDLLYPLR